MSKLCCFLVRVLFVTFFSLTALNTFHDLPKSTERFNEQYLKMQNRFTSATGQPMPKAVHHSTVSKMGESIVFWMCGATLALCLMSFIRPGMAKMAAILWLLSQFLEHEVFNLTLLSPLKSIENMLMMLTVFAGAWIVFTQKKN